VTETPTPAAERQPGTPELLHDRVARAREVVVKSINQAVPGSVTLHYKSRDVVIPVPGDVALRMMVTFRRQRGDGLDDPIDLGKALALHGWTTVSMKTLLAITWDPGPDAAEAVGADLLDLLDALQEPEVAVARVNRLAATEAQAPSGDTDPTEPIVASGPADAMPHDEPRDGSDTAGAAGGASDPER
jgi:hypothetical protein